MGFHAGPYHHGTYGNNWREMQMTLKVDNVLVARGGLLSDLLWLLAMSGSGSLDSSIS